LTNHPVHPCIWKFLLLKHSRCLTYFRLLKEWFGNLAICFVDQEALREYSGSDRYFLRQIVNRVVEVKNQKLIDYVGDYNYYLEKNLEARRRELLWEDELESVAPTVKAKSKMTKAEKELQKKQKVQSFQQGKAKSKVSKNANRWN